jgi:hypothetical protein
MNNPEFECLSKPPNGSLVSLFLAQARAKEGLNSISMHFNLLAEYFHVNCEPVVLHPSIV